MALRGQICGEVPAKSPGSPEKSDNNVEEQLRVVLMNQYERGA